MCIICIVNSGAVNPGGHAWLSPRYHLQLPWKHRGVDHQVSICSNSRQPPIFSVQHQRSGVKRSSFIGVLPPLLNTVKRRLKGILLLTWKQWMIRWVVDVFVEYVLLPLTSCPGPRQRHSAGQSAPTGQWRWWQFHKQPESPDTDSDGWRPRSGGGSWEISRKRES